MPTADLLDRLRPRARDGQVDERRWNGVTLNHPKNGGRLLSGSDSLVDRCVV